MKKVICFLVMLIGIASFASAADQVFFELNGGDWSYPGIFAKVGWMHFWNNEKIGFIGDVSYYNKSFIVKHENDEIVRTITDRTHNIGLAAGIVFNNMGFKGVLRTSEYIKLKGLWQTSTALLPIVPVLDLGFKLDVFFVEKTAFSAGLGLEISAGLPSLYALLGMKFTL